MRLTDTSLSRPAGEVYSRWIQRGHCQKTNPQREGFTLVELLVATGVLGLLLALVLPNLAAVRHSVLSATTTRYLQGFGKGFIDRSVNDPKGRFCSGGYDHLRDGDVRFNSWVGDLIHTKDFKPGKNLDPINPARVSEETAIYMAAIDGSGKVNPNRWEGSLSADGTSVNPDDVTTLTGNNYFGTEENLWDLSYNTNFAASWYFVRGDCMGTGDEIDPLTDDPARCPLDGDGPLSTNHLGDATLLTSPERIALLGPATISNADHDQGSEPDGGVLNQEQAQIINRYIDVVGRKRVVKLGDGICEGMTDGPAAEVAANTLTPYGDNGGQAIHSLSDISPMHKAKPAAVRIETAAGEQTITQSVGGYAPILFADGHVAKVYDAKGSGGRRDGWLGPYRKNDGWTLDQAAIDEIRDALWLGRLRARPAAGGGSTE